MKGNFNKSGTYVICKELKGKARLGHFMHSFTVYTNADNTINSAYWDYGNSEFSEQELEDILPYVKEHLN